ncbi:MAG: RNA 2',3'-cyclic phosphodiesterase [Alphaproteobacteria bacterium]
MIRLFVGLALPPDIRRVLAGLATGIPGARWVDEENYHLTLRFIGEVAENDAHDIHDALSGVRARRFDLMLSGVGHFENGGEVHTLFAAAEREPALMQLRANIESALVRFGVKPDGRRFQPHVTLARMRGAPPDRVSLFLAAHALLRAGPIAIDHFALYSSFLREAGPIYQVEAEYTLALV